MWIHADPDPQPWLKICARSEKEKREKLKRVKNGKERKREKAYKG